MEHFAHEAGLLLFGHRGGRDGWRMVIVLLVEVGCRKSGLKNNLLEAIESARSV